LWLIVLVVLPQLLGSAVNITYNTTQIVNQLSNAQQDVFFKIVLAYNAVVYPAAVLLFAFALRPVWRCWRAIEQGAPLAEGEVESARRRALELPSTIAVLTALGWFPGGILFPLLIRLLAPPLNFELAAHFCVSFFMSGLIALAYSLCGAQFVVLRAIYPRMWRNVRSYAVTATSELAPMNNRLWYTFVLAGSIPLLAALLTLGLGGDPTNMMFKAIVMGMIVLGGVGFYVANAVVRDLSQVIVALTSTKA
jgi:hypothetical protein